jgi:septal ring factor EnvC (AmiA/AmiB activator)
MDKFRSFSVTYKGAKHVGDENCQDASTHVPLDNAVIAVVADGHGSARCFRSDIGSKAAVDATETTIKLWLQRLSESVTDFEDFKAELHAMVKQIINKWFLAVMKDEETTPLQTDPRLEAVTDKYKERYINNPDYRTHAYGTTLMTAVICENYWFAFQVGDGKCVVLYEDGVWKLPIPWDDRCSFNTTTSICDDDSLSSFRYWFGISDDEGGYAEYGYGVNGQNKDYDPNPIKATSRPLAIFVGSDGVEDSYPRVDNDKYVINFYRNRIVTLAESGLESFKEEIDGFAKRFADRESTDDVSVAGIVGDFTSKVVMIESMKLESVAHETGELVAIKHRDLDEKRVAFESVEKHTAAVTKTQTDIENKIQALKENIVTLDTTKRLHKSTLVRVNNEVSTSDRSMLDIQGNIRRLEAEKVESEREERMVASRVSVANDDTGKAKKALGKAEKEYASKYDSLLKKQRDHDKHMKKLSAPKPLVAPPINQTLQGYTQTGKPITITVIDNRNLSHSAGLSSVSAPFVMASDAKLEDLKQAIVRLNAELQLSQTKVTNAKQNAEQKDVLLVGLRQQLSNAQQRTLRIESDLARGKHEYQMAETQNRNQRADVKQCQAEIDDTERRIRTKQAEIEKLNAELESLKEQTKKQTDMLDSIRNALKTAEYEVKKLEAFIAGKQANEEE